MRNHLPRSQRNLSALERHERAQRDAARVTHWTSRQSIALNRSLQRLGRVTPKALEALEPLLAARLNSPTRRAITTWWEVAAWEQRLHMLARLRPKHDFLIPALTRAGLEADPWMARQIADALASIAHPAGQILLLELLPDCDASILESVARALGAVADRRAIAPLTARAERADPAAQACLDAVEAILERFPADQIAAQPGSLTAVEEHAGGLSLVVAAQGELTAYRDLKRQSSSGHRDPSSSSAPLTTRDTRDQGWLAADPAPRHLPPTIWAEVVAARDPWQALAWLTVGLLAWFIPGLHGPVFALGWLTALTAFGWIRRRALILTLRHVHAVLGRAFRRKQGWAVRYIARSGRRRTITLDVSLEAPEAGVFLIDERGDEEPIALSPRRFALAPDDSGRLGAATSRTLTRLIPFALALASILARAITLL